MSLDIHYEMRVPYIWQSIQKEERDVMRLKVRYVYDKLILGVGIMMSVTQELGMWRSSYRTIWRLARRRTKHREQRHQITYQVTAGGQ